MKLLLFVLCIVAFICVNAQNDNLKTATEVSHWFARATIDPPCDYRNKKVDGKWVRSPCSNKRGNRLPKLSYSDKLQKSAQAFVNTCPSSSSLELNGGGENLYLSFRHKGVMTDSEVVWKGVLKWSEGAASYNPETGRCSSGFCMYYKQIIATNNKKVGCAINRNCGGRKIVLVCHYEKEPTAGPQYPVLIFDAPLKNTFVNQLLRGVNHLRRRVDRRCSIKQKTQIDLKCPKLSKVKWSAELEKKAQSWANTLKTAKIFENKKIQRIFLHPSKIYASAAYPALVSRDWRRSTQVLGESTKEIGCGQTWYKGCTWVVCYFR